MGNLKDVAGLDAAKPLVRFVELGDGSKMTNVEFVLAKQLIQRIAAFDRQRQLVVVGLWSQHERRPEIDRGSGRRNGRQLGQYRSG